MTLISISIQSKGGPGSGNWGHRGIPGKVGGSSPRGAVVLGTGSPAYGKLGDVDRRANDMLLNVAKGGYNDNDLQRLVDYGKKSITQMQDMGVSTGVIIDKYKRGVQENQAMLDSNSHWATTTDSHRGVVKSNILSKLSDRTGLSRMDVNRVVGEWAKTSNDMSRQAISLQEAVTEEFDVKLSKWQENSIRSKSFMERKDERKLLRAMYNNTQTELRKAGYKTGDTVTLYRGYVGDNTATTPNRGTDVDYKGNAMESWSVLAGVAYNFGYDDKYGRVLSMKVPIDNIISTAATGLGCLTEGEFVILGSGEGNVAHVMSLGDLGL